MTYLTTKLITESCFLNIFIFINGSFYLYFSTYCFSIPRYCDYLYLVDAKIEIIDKAQDSEMALPTAMTIFNRSMINLENEKGVLNSYILHKRVASRLKSNVRFYAQARVRANQIHKSSFFNDYDLKFNINTDDITEESIFFLDITDENMLKISHEKDGDIIEYDFENYSTYSSKHKLPFELTINDATPGMKRIIQIIPFEEIIEIYDPIFQLKLHPKKAISLF